MKITLLLLFFFSFPLFSSEFLNDKDAFSYCSECLHQEEKRFAASRKYFYDQLKFVGNVHDILLDFLNSANEEEFYDQMRQFKPYIETLSKTSRDLFFQVYPDKFCDRRAFKVEDSINYAYYNIFHHSRAQSDQERKAAYENELKRHRGIKLLPGKQLTAKSIETLTPGQSYNFIVNLRNEAYISYEQRYRLRKAHGKILNNPDHTLLAGNNPVLSAGVLDVHKVGRKELYFLICSSGHFHPRPDSMAHMKKHLMGLGIPEEAIIVFNLKHSQVIHLMAKKH